jgi:hypothetical protein
MIIERFIITHSDMMIAAAITKHDLKEVVGGGGADGVQR